MRKHSKRYDIYLNHFEVYDGVWGYNTLLAMSSTSCVFFAFSGYSFILGLVNVGATGVSHYAMRTNMTLQVRSI